MIPHISNISVLLIKVVIKIIKGELDFGLDSFGRQKVMSPEDTLAHLLINLLFMRPGQFPSMPHLGINIRKYLYNFSDELDVETLKSEIQSQCLILVPYLDLTGMVLDVIDYLNDSFLLLVIPVNFQDSEKSLILGFKTDDDKVLFDFKFEDKLT